MSNYLLVDFDGTLTRRDTTRFLVLSLLQLRPWRLYLIIYGYLRLFFAQKDSEIQCWKNWCVGKLLQGLDRHQVAEAVVHFVKKVRPLIRPDILDYLKSRQFLGENVLIVTASFEDAVAEVLRETGFLVLGNQYDHNGVLFNSEIVLPECFAEGKVARIESWMHKLNESMVFTEAWSDALSDVPMMRLANQQIWVCRLTEQSNFVSVFSGARFWNID